MKNKTKDSACDMTKVEVFEWLREVADNAWKKGYTEGYRLGKADSDDCWSLEVARLKMQIKKSGCNE